MCNIGADCWKGVSILWLPEKRLCRVSGRTTKYAITTNLPGNGSHLRQNLALKALGGCSFDIPISPGTVIDPYKYRIRMSSAVWKSRWPSWAVPNKPTVFCGRKAPLQPIIYERRLHLEVVSLWEVICHRKTCISSENAKTKTKKTKNKTSFLVDDFLLQTSKVACRALHLDRNSMIYNLDKKSTYHKGMSAAAQNQRKYLGRGGTNH